MNTATPTAAPPTAWKITGRAPRPVIQAALIAHEDAAEWDPDIILSGFEIADDRPEDWVIEAWLDHPPTPQDLAAIAALFTDAGEAPALTAEPLPDRDWVTESQHGLAPIAAGRFRVLTPEAAAAEDAAAEDAATAENADKQAAAPARDARRTRSAETAPVTAIPHAGPIPAAGPNATPRQRRFIIPASGAFGTGHHATTAGCLAMLTHMRERGVLIRNLVDVGTGTGLLAFAALDLWPRANAIAADIDRVCAPLVLANAAANGIPIAGEGGGGGPGQLAMVIAPGLDHPLLAARAPYDLIIANILASPLIDLAPAFGRATIAGGHVLLSGLLATQEAEVRTAMFRAGLRLAARAQHGDWSVLWLRKRVRYCGR